MEKRNYRTLLVPLLFLALAVALIVNCGGGGGGGSSSVSDSGVGTVAVYLTDSPADDYAHIWIWITEISLIPENGGAPVVIFEHPSGTPAGVQVDLLALKDEENIFQVRKDVPAGTYSKIRLDVSQIETEAKPGVITACAEVDLIKLPSGKIDLNPRGPFTVVPDGIISITLDIDANKSINLHPTGQGKCIFRPVVFVDITEGFRSGCPQVLRGTIVPGTLTDDGFLLQLKHSGTYVDVKLREDVRIFDSAGEFSTDHLAALSAALDLGLNVWVRGNLAEGGIFEASFVVIGDILKVAGIVHPTISPEEFSMAAFEGEAIVGQKLVKIFDETLILRDCNNEVLAATILSGMRVRVFGKEVGNYLNAAVILLDVTGKILTLQDTTGGQTATIREEIQGNLMEPVAVIIPDGTSVNTEGNGSLDESFLCVGRYVRIVFGSTGQLLTAEKVYLKLDQDGGVVSGINAPNRTIFLSTTGGTLTVRVPVDAQIYEISERSQVTAGFSDIAVGDTVAFSGLEVCPIPSATFDARFILLWK
jgi:hypothetical protein